MRHQNSVFHTVLKHLPWQAFDRLVEAHGADARVRRLSTRDQFVALLYGQLAGAQSLREIESGLASHAHLLYHLGARAVSRSTLSDANATRPSEVFGALFAHLVAQAGRGLRRKIGEAVHLIDSTGLRLSELSAEWARFSDGVCGAKLHIVFDPDAESPSDAAITPARVNDIATAQALPIAAGATYVFDLGYYDFAWWARLDDAGCRIVTRLKSNTRLTVVAENRVSKDGPILSDRIGYLPTRLAASRINPFQAPVREIRVRQNPAHPHQRHRCNRRRNRRPLQTPLADRAVLSLDQADLEDQALPRHVRKRRPHPGRRRPHRVSAAAPRLRNANSRQGFARLHPPRARQPHAPTRNRSLARSTAAHRPRSAPVDPQPMLILNRTAVTPRRA